MKDFKDICEGVFDNDFEDKMIASLGLDWILQHTKSVSSKDFDIDKKGMLTLKGVLYFPNLNDDVPNLNMNYCNTMKCYWNGSHKERHIFLPEVVDTLVLSAEKSKIYVHGPSKIQHLVIECDDFEFDASIIIEEMEISRLTLMDLDKCKFPENVHVRMTRNEWNELCYSAMLEKLKQWGNVQVKIK